MESNLTNASLLLIIGMGAVFFILLIVVTGGKLLIRLINKVELEIHEMPFIKIRTEHVSTSKEQVIKEAVKVLTQGKGRVEKIEKISP
ncbi:MAG: hypothetical protein WAU01_16005 [Saprospiraceae bacterium]